MAVAGEEDTVEVVMKVVLMKMLVAAIPVLADVLADVMVLAHGGAKQHVKVVAKALR